jgi:hypothetical protein
MVAESRFQFSVTVRRLESQRFEDKQVERSA